MATGVGIEPTGGIAAAQTLSGRRRYDRSGTPPYGDLCGIRTHICSLRGCRPDRLDEEAVLVTPTGFEPGIAAVKGRCPCLLDERAMTAP